jgi:S1-C subfamily serine protease
VVQEILPSSVQIIVEQDGRRLRSGSGVVVGARGSECLVLTSGHTVSRRSESDGVFILFGRHRGAGTKAHATVVAHRDTQDTDLALLRTNTHACSPARFGNPPWLGDPIWVVAYPWGRHMTLVAGIVSQVNLDVPGDRTTAPRLIVDASVSYGSSGGGVYDAEGGLVGIVEGYRTARVSFEGNGPPQYISVPVPGETYVVPLVDIRGFLTEAGQSELAAQLPIPSGSRK